MARYIDADKLSKNLGNLDTGFTGIMPIEFVYTEDIDKAPTADVVPKSEVERLERICNSYALQYGTVRDQQKVIDKAKAEVAREIFEEIENIIENNRYKSYLANSPFWGWSYRIVGIINGIAELKKKYTEEKL